MERINSSQPMLGERRGEVNGSHRGTDSPGAMRACHACDRPHGAARLAMLQPSLIMRADARANSLTRGGVSTMKRITTAPLFGGLAALCFTTVTWAQVATAAVAPTAGNATMGTVSFT